MRFLYGLAPLHKTPSRRHTSNSITPKRPFWTPATAQDLLPGHQDISFRQEAANLSTQVPFLHHNHGVATILLSCDIPGIFSHQHPHSITITVPIACARALGQQNIMAAMATTTGMTRIQRTTTRSTDGHLAVSFLGWGWMRVSESKRLSPRSRARNMQGLLYPRCDYLYPPLWSTP